VTTNKGKNMKTLRYAEPLPYENGTVPYKVGTTVESLETLEDTDRDGNLYIHAEPGTTGVICGYYASDGVPTIDWGAGTGIGFYDVNWNQIRILAD
tara:strand:- start:494 stop:781 length:288 start_codon:yes stop_codon:yes gene_type:complete